MYRLSLVAAVVFWMMGLACGRPFVEELFPPVSGGAGGTIGLSSEGGATYGGASQGGRPSGGAAQGGAGGVSQGGSAQGGSVPGGMPSGGGAGGSAGSPQGGAPPQPPLYTLVYTLVDHPPNTYMGIGGIIDQPTGPDLEAKVFPGCIASSPQDVGFACDLGPLESGTTLQLFLAAYNNNVGDPPPFAYYLCDQAGFPSSDCKGEVEIFKDGVLIASFEDDDLAATPPPVPWSYVEVDTFLQLFHPGLP